MIAFILLVFYLSVMLWSFGKLPLFVNSKLTAKGLSALFLLKLTFSIGLVLVYTYYYTDRGLADVYKYFDDGNTIHASIGAHPKAAFKVITGIGFDHNDPDIKAVLANTHHFDKKGEGFVESNHRITIRVNVLLRFLSYGSIYVHTLFFCFLSFIGSVALYRVSRLFFDKGTGMLLIIPIFLLPSLLFWASGPLQESLVLFFLGILFFSAVKLVNMKNIFANLFLVIIFLNLLYLAKPFIAISFLLSFYIMGTFHFKGYIRIVAILVATLGIMWFCYAHNTFICEISSSMVSKRNDFVSLGLKMKAGSLVDNKIYDTGCLSPVPLIPSALYNMFLQPFVWSHGVFEKLFGLENLLVLLLTVFTLFNFQRPKAAKLQLAVFCLCFFLLNYVLIGVTVPIIGALVRYKIFGLLFYLVLLVCLLDLNKIIFIINKSNLLLKLTQRAQKMLFA